jgi:hypothetical protein
MLRLCEAAEARLKGTSFSLQKTVECELRVESVIVQVYFVFSVLHSSENPFRFALIHLISLHNTVMYPSR